jgi:hypothetical protein
MIDDNLKTLVEAMLSGEERRFNRRFLALANLDLFEPVACTPGSGWEKGCLKLGELKPTQNAVGMAEFNARSPGSRQRVRTLWKTSSCRAGF